MRVLNRAQNGHVNYGTTKPSPSWGRLENTIILGHSATCSLYCLLSGELGKWESEDMRPYALTQLLFFLNVWSRIACTANANQVQKHNLSRESTEALFLRKTAQYIISQPFPCWEDNFSESYKTFLTFSFSHCVCLWLSLVNTLEGAQTSSRKKWLMESLSLGVRGLTCPESLARTSPSRVTCAEILPLYGNRVVKNPRGLQMSKAALLSFCGLGKSPCCLEQTGAGKSWFTVVSTQKQFILVFLFISYYIMFHTNDCKPPSAHPHTATKLALWSVHLTVFQISHQLLVYISPCHTWGRGGTK